MCFFQCSAVSVLLLVFFHYCFYISVFILVFYISVLLFVFFYQCSSIGSRLQVEEPRVYLADFPPSEDSMGFKGAGMYIR